MYVIETTDGRDWLAVGRVGRWPAAFLARVARPERWRVRDLATNDVRFVNLGGKPGTLFRLRTKR